MSGYGVFQESFFIRRAAVPQYCPVTSFLIVFHGEYDMAGISRKADARKVKARKIKAKTTAAKARSEKPTAADLRAAKVAGIRAANAKTASDKTAGDKTAKTGTTAPAAGNTVIKRKPSEKPYPPFHPIPVVKMKHRPNEALQPTTHASAAADNDKQDDHKKKPDKPPAEPEKKQERDYPKFHPVPKAAPGFTES